MREYGYELIDLPMIQPADIFLIKAGDQIVNRLFTFERRGQQLSLRPEFTAAATYNYLNENGLHSPIVRWQFGGYVFAENSNEGVVNHQHYSIGAELIGMDGSLADSEIVAMAAIGLEKQGIQYSEIAIGHTGLLRQLLSQFHLDSHTERYILNHMVLLKDETGGKKQVIERLDKWLSSSNSLEHLRLHQDVGLETTSQLIETFLDTPRNGSSLGGRTLYDMAQRIIQKQSRLANRDQIIAALELLAQWGQITSNPIEAFSQMAELISDGDVVSQSLVAEWKNVIQHLDLYGISKKRIKIQADLARSWDYYTGMVFEMRNSDGFHLAGGGRYNGLNKLLGGKQNVPAVGFAYYLDHIIPTISKLDMSEQFITILTKRVHAVCGIRWANLIRNEGFNAQLIMDITNVSSPQPVLMVSDNETVGLEGVFYSFDQKNILISELRRRLS